MEKRKVLFLKKPQTQEWHSCKTILQNLEQAYTLAFGEDLVIADTSDLNSLAAHHPQIIVLADQRLNYEYVVGSLKSVMKGPIDWVIHAYGCFPGRVTEFMNAYERMRPDRLKIITASSCFQKMIQQLFHSTEMVSKCPFPVSNPEVQPFLRDKLRAEIGIKQDESVFLYAGRISYQKNVHQLIHLFRQLPLKNNYKLVICGPIDDLNPKMNEQGPVLGLAEKLFHEELKNANSENRSVIYLGNKTQSELIGLYQMADAYVSLSTHLGEDFGLAAAEALAHGLPCRLSNWGGFQDFSALSSVRLFHPTKLSAEDFFSLETYSGSDEALQYFGIPSVAE
jgi:glycosyltransferase involved in cell wall biosynthesis